MSPPTRLQVLSRPSSTPVLHLFLALALVLSLLVTSTTAATNDNPTLFCKCLCPPGNSTIIPANSCGECNRQFCVDYKLPNCKDVKEEDVTAVCIQRDSVKDQIVVCLFIGATVGLLAWALIRPFVTRWVEVARRQSEGLGFGRQGQGRAGAGAGEYRNVPEANQNA
ncbi:hypothetical protein EX30DRAFT_337145 [Ascodesmis nigricans]|uniref:Membrane anchor Opy2 N-terminal domain-containing protein n=1 Tax=Ascodesmis nigricans TaxID=341454 RepID=A0A4V3SJM7_9PEZI|nr:hypothetical protein EX30DRAFT_337145 [Ascodesmis nigricans]